MTDRVTTGLATKLHPVTGPGVWYGSEQRESRDWRLVLGDEDIVEIDTAIRSVRARILPLEDVTRDDFTLPGLGPRLDRWCGEVLEGRGFIVIRGLPVGRWGLEDSALAFWGLGTYVGWAVSQNARGHLLGHVRDIGHDPANPLHRLYATRARHPFHTDSCDIVALLCVRGAKTGGLSSVSSTPTIYNEMVETRPELAAVLSEPLYWDRKGEVPAGREAYYRLPVFNHFGGHLTTVYARDFIEGAQRFGDVPRLTLDQRAALDLFDALAAREDIRLNMELQPGDVQFLHNHQTVHSRTEYEDHPEPERKRHLLRLWLSPVNGRPLPPALAERYGSVDLGGPRGGIVVPGAVLHAPLTPALHSDAPRLFGAKGLGDVDPGRPTRGHVAGQDGDGD